MRRKCLHAKPAEQRCREAIAIAKRLGELIKVDTIRLPSERGGRYFYSKRAAGQDLFVLYMRRGTGPEEVLIDPASLSADHTTSVNFEGLSDDGTLVAYGVRKGGEDEVFEFISIDTDTRKAIPDSLPRARYISGASFKTDRSGFYYSKLTDEGPRAYYHAMGTSAEQDTKIFGDGYASDKILVAEVSEDGRYLLSHCPVWLGVRKI
jgi:prolyl oligopeptidase